MKMLGFPASMFFFSIYVLHTLWGKLARMGLIPMSYSLGEVGEFLVVLACMFCFVVGLYGLEREHQANPKSHS